MPWDCLNNNDLVVKPGPESKSPNSSFLWISNIFNSFLQELLSGSLFEMFWDFPVSTLRSCFYLSSDERNPKTKTSLSIRRRRKVQNEVISGGIKDRDVKGRPHWSFMITGCSWIPGREHWVVQIEFSVKDWVCYISALLKSVEGIFANIWAEL